MTLLPTAKMANAPASGVVALDGFHGLARREERAIGAIGLHRPFVHQPLRSGFAWGPVRVGHSYITPHGAEIFQESQ